MGFNPILECSMPQRTFDCGQRFDLPLMGEAGASRRVGVERRKAKAFPNLSVPGPDPGPER
jgi:hypothetical protein